MSESAPDDREDEGPVSDSGFRGLLDKLNSQYGFDVREYKQASLARRIRTRMQQVRIESFANYGEYLDRHAGEHVALFNTILINVTRFFRDAPAWQLLAEQVLPTLIASAAETRTLRIWSAGCSSGEEAYSVAMLLAEGLGERARDFNVKIYATDVDEDALTTARHALYRPEDLKDVPTPLVERYFTRESHVYRFWRDLRRWCIFGHHNVAQDPPLSHIDLLICRNVLIYFTTDLQERLLQRFHYATREGGYLFLGRSESLLARSRWFAPIDVKWRIFQRTPAPAPTISASLVRGTEASARAAAGRGRTEAPGRLLAVIEALPMAVMAVDTADTVCVWNRAAEALYEIPAESAIGRKFRDLDVSYRIEGLRARVEDVKVKHIPSRLEGLTFNRRSGELAHVEIAILPMLEDQRVGSVLVVAIEAAEHARLKEQMTRVAEQYATAIEELQSTNEELETTNEELQSTNEELETTNEELQSTNEELETTVEELQAANSEMAALNSEMERRSGDRRRSDERHQSVLDSFEAPVLVFDRDAVVTAWNEATARMLGLRADQVVGRPFWTLPIGEITRLAREPLMRVLDTGEPETVTRVPLPGRPGGRQGSLLLSPLRSPDGGTMGVVGLMAPAKSD
jgi:two-component system, chemotaxis family, CheB/CheR fusion protein